MTHHKTSAWRAVRQRTKRFILVYRLAIDARPKWGDVVTGRKYPSLLEGFPDGRSINGSYETSATTARGLLCFCLTARYGFKKFKRFNGFNSALSVQSVVEYNPKDRNSPPVKGYRCGSSGAFLYCQRQLFCFLGA